MPGPKDRPEAVAGEANSRPRHTQDTPKSLTSEEVSYIRIEGGAVITECQ